MRPTRTSREVGIALRGLSLAILLCLAPRGAVADQAVEDLARIQAAYAGLERFSVEISFALYAAAGSEVVEESGRALVRRHGDLYWSRTFHLETLLNQRYLVLADHDSRTLMIDRRPEFSRAPAEPMQIDLEAILGESLDPDQLTNREAGSITARPAAGGRRSLTIEYPPGEYPSGEYHSIELTFDSRTYLIDRMVLHFRQPLPIRADSEPAAPHIEIRYSDFQADPAFPPGAFSEERYFALSAEGTIVAGPEYRDYRIIDHLTTGP